MSIILEALTRFIEPPDINNPKLILIVGSAGLFSNLLGFVVLGGHGHDHGDEEHGDEHDQSHDHDHDHSHDIEQGHRQDDLRSEVANEDGAVGDILPEVVLRRATNNSDRATTESPETARRIRFGDDSNSRGNHSPSTPRGRDRRRSSKSGHSRFQSIEDLSIHPASFRQGIIAASNAASSGAVIPSGSDTSEDAPVGDSETEVNEESPLLAGGAKHSNGAVDSRSHSAFGSKRRPRRDSSVHHGHNHTMPRKPGSKTSGHNHADMGMNAMMLHVLGDALGNVGVILTALVIWLTDWPGKLYADPAVSLIITAIILKTSVPLTLATAKVLLQATPENISIQEIRQDIEGLPGVVSCHHIHVWQLSDTKVVASLHLQVAFPITEHSGEKYMQLAKRARKCLHGYGIHSATIQPEFCLDQEQRHAGDALALRMDGTGENACLIDCADDCEAQGQGCCPVAETSSKASSTRRGSDSTQGEGHHTH